MSCAARQQAISEHRSLQSLDRIAAGLRGADQAEAADRIDRARATLCGELGRLEAEILWLVRQCALAAAAAEAKEARPAAGGMTDLKLLDEVLCLWKGTRSWAEFEGEYHITDQAIGRLRAAWAGGEMPVITLSLADYFEQGAVAATCGPKSEGAYGSGERPA